MSVRRGINGYKMADKTLSVRIAGQPRNQGGPPMGGGGPGGPGGPPTMRPAYGAPRPPRGPPGAGLPPGTPPGVPPQGPPPPGYGAPRPPPPVRTLGLLNVGATGQLYGCHLPADGLACINSSSRPGSLNHNFMQN